MAENEIIPIDQMLPNKIPLVPLLGRPIFPGIFTPIMAEEQLGELEDTLRLADQAFATLKGDKLLDEIMPLVKRFNETTFNSCGSERLTELVWSLREVFDRYRVMRVVLPNHVELSLSRRRALYEAFRARDPDKAAEIWGAHLDESFGIWREKSGRAEELKDFRFF